MFRLLLHSDTRNRQEIKEYYCQTASGFHSSSKLRPTTQVIDAVVFFFFLLSTTIEKFHIRPAVFFLSIFFSAAIFFVPFSGTQQQCPTTTTTTTTTTTDERQRLEKLAHDSRDHSKHVFRVSRLVAGLSVSGTADSTRTHT